MLSSSSATKTKRNLLQRSYLVQCAVLEECYFCRRKEQTPDAFNIKILKVLFCYRFQDFFVSRGITHYIKIFYSYLHKIYGIYKTDTNKYRKNGRIINYPMYYISCPNKANCFRN